MTPFFPLSPPSPPLSCLRDTPMVASHSTPISLYVCASRSVRGQSQVLQSVPARLRDLRISAHGGEISACSAGEIRFEGTIMPSDSSVAALFASCQCGLLRSHTAGSEMLGGASTRPLLRIQLLSCFVQDGSAVACQVDKDELLLIEPHHGDLDDFHGHISKLLERIYDTIHTRPTSFWRIDQE